MDKNLNLDIRSGSDKSLNKLIHKLQNGYKLCIAGMSMDCLKLSRSENFIGNYCHQCHDLKKRHYHKKYNQLAKQRAKEAYDEFILSKNDIRSGLDDSPYDNSFNENTESGYDLTEEDEDYVSDLEE